MHTDEMMSLYDYLKKPAGAELGKQVEAAARLQGIHSTYKEVSTRNYNGKVRMYPKSFLEQYFNSGPKSATDILYNEPDDLIL